MAGIFDPTQLDPNQQIGQQAGAQVDFTPGAPSTPEEFEARKKTYTDFLSNPQVKQMMLLTGLHMLANRNASGPAQALGQGALFATGALSAQAGARRQAEQQERRLALEEELGRAGLEDKDLDRAQRKAEADQRAADEAAGRKLQERRIGLEGAGLGLRKAELDEARKNREYATYGELFKLAQSMATVKTIEGGESVDPELFAHYVKALEPFRTGGTRVGDADAKLAAETAARNASKGMMVQAASAGLDKFIEVTLAAKGIFPPAVQAMMATWSPEQWEEERQKVLQGAGRTTLTRAKPERPTTPPTPLAPTVPQGTAPTDVSP